MIEVGKVAMIRIEDIEIGERARKEMGDLAGLEGSMKQVGLAQPICVKEQTNNGKPYFLLGGERRFCVLLANGNTVIPVRIYPETITPIEVKSIELAENFFRKDFEPPEYDKLIAEIHCLQQQIHGAKLSTAADATGWGMKETGELMGISKMSVSTAIKRHEAREAFPELFEGCKTQKDATKVLEKLQEAVVKEALAKKIEEKKGDTTLRSLANAYVLRDFFEGVKEFPDNYFHLVEIDPPYAINLTEAKKKDGISNYNLGDYNEVSQDSYPKFLYNTFSECYKKMTDHSWLICWFAPEPWFEIIHQMLIQVGFGTSRMCGIWTKGTPGQSMNPSIRLANSYEMFFYAWKGQPALAKAGHGNDFHFPPVPSSQKTHPTERPIELMKEIYETFAFPGSRILIPFLGSGVGIFAAADVGMSAMGFELGKSHKDSFLVKAHARCGGSL